MIAEALPWVTPAVFAAMLIIAAVMDILHRRIPNWTVAALIVTYLAAVAAGLAPSPLLSGLGAAAITFAVTYLLYHFNIFGAGDAKLFSAAALFAGLANLGTLALLTVLFGGAIALGFLLLRPDRAMRALTTRGRSSGEKSGIPYGVAIALGAITTGAVTPGFLPPIG